MAFFLSVARTIGSIHRYKIKQKWSRRDDEFHDLLMSKSPVVGQVCRISHFLARYNSRYVTEKSSNDKKTIVWIIFDQICFELATFEEFATAVDRSIDSSDALPLFACKW